MKSGPFGSHLPGVSYFVGSSQLLPLGLETFSEPESQLVFLSCLFLFLGTLSKSLVVTFFQIRHP